MLNCDETKDELQKNLQTGNGPEDKFGHQHRSFGVTARQWATLPFCLKNYLALIFF
jgi:hypothetical protein